jgi:hypothetical protein
MRPVQAGGRAGGLAGWQVGRQSTAGRTCDGRTLRGADCQQLAPSPPTLQAREEEVVAADPIDIHGRDEQQAQESSTHVALAQQGALPT